MTIDRVLCLGRALWRRLGDAPIALILFAASLTLYLRTLAPSVVAQFDDSLEFPLVAHRLAIAHPTGYPLYVLLARLFTLGPWPNVAWAVNLLSAVAGALTVALLYLAIRQVACRRWAALLGASSLAVCPVFWSQSTVSEVYTLNTAFVAAALWLALRWAREPLAPVRPFELLLAAPGATGAEPPVASRKPAVFGKLLRRIKPGTEAPGRDAPVEGAGDPDDNEPPSATRHLLSIIGHLLSAIRPLLLSAWRLLRRAAHWSASALRRAGRWLAGTYRRIFPAVPPKRRLRPHPLLYALAGALGLSLAHHRTTLLIVPALLVFALLVERRIYTRAAWLGPEHARRPAWRRLLGRPIVGLACCLLLPLLLYLYLPIRGHVGSLDGMYANTWSGFWRWVASGGYTAFLGDNPLARDLDAAFYGRLLWDQFGPVGLALSLVGLAGLLRRLPVLALTGLAFGAYAGFALLYRVPDVEVFFLPALLMLAVWIGAGLDHALDLLRPRGPSLALRRLLACCLALLLLAAFFQPLALAAGNYADLDLSRRWLVHDYGLYVLDQPIPHGSTVVGLLGEATLLRYFQETSGYRPDVETVAADGEQERRAAVQAALRRGRSTYVTRLLPGLDADYGLDAVTGLIDVDGDWQALIQVGEPDREVPDLPRPAGAEPVPGLHLLGTGLAEHQAHWQAWACLRLWWQAPQGLGEPLKVSARLLDAAGHLVAAVDAEPVGGTYPTTSWRPGEVVADAYEIPLPAGLPPGQYRPLVILYDPATGAERGRVELEAVRLRGSALRPPRRALEAAVGRVLYARFGELELLGVTAADPAVSYRPGDELPLTLLWQAWRKPSGQYRLSLWLEGHQGAPLGELPAGGELSADRWERGQVVRQVPGLVLPAGLPPGSYRLYVRVYDEGGAPVPWGRWWIPLGSDLELGTVRVGG